MKTITQAVGIRNGVVLPNLPADLKTVTELFDLIPMVNGGTSEMSGLWNSDRNILIEQLAIAITAFQTKNALRVIDGAIDPGGATIKLMNQLAAPEPIVIDFLTQETTEVFWAVAEPSSLFGTTPLRVREIQRPINRFLISVSDNSSIKWFGVVIPDVSADLLANCVPHIFFTPSPWQGGYQDNTYDDFTQWNPLWIKYTGAIGSQVVESGVSQILVIPFYKNSQSGNLGDFLTNWRAVITAVITGVINLIDPTVLRDKFEFDHIYSSSFSNGIVTHQNFNTRAVGADSMTIAGIDLDGQAAGSNWRPRSGISYRNTAAPRGVNPSGSDWFVGGRFAQLRPFYTGSTDHNLCPFLLLHGLTVT
jgi:hypothetical protein